MISKHMRKIRKLRKMTQEELTKKTKISVKQIEKYESDFESLCKSSITTSKKIAKALRCKVEDIAPYEEIIKLEQEQKKISPSDNNSFGPLNHDEIFNPHSTKRQ